jgi:hypothetical protein
MFQIFIAVIIADYYYYVIIIDYYYYGKMKLSLRDTRDDVWGLDA